MTRSLAEHAETLKLKTRNASHGGAENTEQIIFRLNIESSLLVNTQRC
jgi:hypothetical protein